MGNLTIPKILATKLFLSKNFVFLKNYYLAKELDKKMTCFGTQKVTILM